LLALGLTPGEDILTVVGVPTLEAACLFTAAVSVGIGYAVSWPKYHLLNLFRC